MKDLRELYPRYKFRLTEDYKYQEEEDRWDCIEIVCKYGFISYFSADSLYVECHPNSILTKKLAAIPGCVIQGSGIDESVFKCPLTEIKQVFKVLKPQLNDVEKKKLVKQLKKK